MAWDRTTGRRGIQVRRLAQMVLSPSGNVHLYRGQIFDAALPAASSTGSQTGENGGA